MAGHMLYQSGKISQPPLLTSRLLPPRLPARLVERVHLFTRLDAGLSYPLILLQAPAGSGKTTLVAHWLSQRHVQGTLPAVAWLSLDKDCNDPLRFWRYVIAACQTWQENVGRTALELFCSAIQPSFDDPPSQETALTYLLNDIAQLAADRLLVLDDYHALEEPAVHQTLAFFLDHLPPTLHVLLISRAGPPLPLVRWRARGTLYELQTPDLCFSPQETAAFLQQMLPVSLSDTAIAQLHTALQGWPAGLRLLSLALQQRQITPDTVEQHLRILNEQPATTFLQQPLLDYFVTEILHAQPAPLRFFLLQTSVLSLLSGPLCDAVTGRENSTELLETIERAGLFLEVLEEADREGTWYRYHALFAEALRYEAGRSLGDQVLSSLSKRASLWYEQHALPSEAIEAALLAGDMEHAARLIEQVEERDNQENRWEPQTLRRWLEQIPEEILRRHPALCLSYAMALRFPQRGKGEDHFSPAHKERIEQLFQMAEENWRNENNPDALGGLYTFRALSVLRQEPVLASEFAQRALALLPKDSPERSVQIGRGVCLSVVGLKKVHEGHFYEAQQHFQEAHACSLTSGDRSFIRKTTALLGMSGLALGELHQAAEYFRQVHSADHEGSDSEDIVQALLGQARLSLEWNALAMAEQQIQKAQALAHESGAGYELADQAGFLFALLCFARGQITSAQQQLATLLARVQAGPMHRGFWLLSEILYWQARLYLATGDLQNAAHSLEQLAHDSRDHISSQYARVQILQARLQLARGETYAARSQLERLLSPALERQQRYTVLEIQVLLALSYAASQQREVACRWLQQALIQAHSEGFLRLFLDEGEPLAHLLHQMLPTIRDKALRSYAQSILRAFSQPGGDTAPSRNLLPEPLSLQEQRVLRLLAAGYTNPQIAQELVVSVNTVKDHIKHLYRKLGVSNRLQASEAARALNLD